MAWGLQDLTSRLGGTLSLDGDVGQQFTLSLGALKTAAVASEEVLPDAQQEALKSIMDSAAGGSLIIALSSSKKWAAFTAYCQQDRIAANPRDGRPTPC